MTTATVEGTIIYQTSFTSDLSKPKISKYTFIQELPGHPNSILVKKPTGGLTWDERKYYDDQPDKAWPSALRMVNEKIASAQAEVEAAQAKLAEYQRQKQKIEKHLGS